MGADSQLPNGRKVVRDDSQNLIAPLSADTEFDHSVRVWRASLPSEPTERATANEFHGKAFNFFRQLLLNPRMVCVKVYSDDEVSILILFNSDSGNTGLIEQFRGVATLDFVSFLFR
jgi:hypothetical protein